MTRNAYLYLITIGLRGLRAAGFHDAERCQSLRQPTVCFFPVLLAFKTRNRLSGDSFSVYNTRGAKTDTYGLIFRINAHTKSSRSRSYTTRRMFFNIEFLKCRCSKNSFSLTQTHLATGPGGFRSNTQKHEEVVRGVYFCKIR